MAKTIPMIITNNSILIKEKESDKFIGYDMTGLENEPNIPFYHQYAKKIAESQYHFKTFMKELYGKKVSKYVLAIITPDDTSALEKIFINEFFLHSDACKAVSQLKMGQALSKEESKYVSISRSMRNIVVQYICEDEILAEKLYDTNNYDTQQIIADSKRIHLDVECGDIPVFVNNFEMNMEEFLEMGTEITTKDFLEKIANVHTEKA